MIHKRELLLCRWAQSIANDVHEVLERQAICFEMPEYGNTVVPKSGLMGYCGEGKHCWWIGLNTLKHETAEELWITVLHECAHAQSIENGRSWEENYNHCEDWEICFQDLLLQFPFSLYKESYPC